MKKIIITATVQVDSVLTPEDLLAALSRMGKAELGYSAEVGVLPPPANHESLWVYVSSDDSEPYVKVSGPDETEGETIDRAELESLQQRGVCVAFYGQHPRSDKYGAPYYASDDVFAEGIVGEHGFNVSSNGLEVHAEDRGDDGAEQIWLNIHIPKLD
jgi:hypothetical protein